MNSWTLSDEYLLQAKVRRKALTLYVAESAHAVVVRETQELVELLLKGLLRRVGIDPPKWHDVGQVLLENESRFNTEIRNSMARIVRFSSHLRRDRELSFYGAEDYLPSKNYGPEDSQRCLAEADWLIAIAERFYTSLGAGST